MAVITETESPILLFFALLTAKERNDFAAAAEAQRRLEEQGIRIRFAPQGNGPNRQLHKQRKADNGR